MSETIIKRAKATEKSDRWLSWASRMCSEGMKMAASRCGLTRLLLPIARTTFNNTIRSVHEGFLGPKYDQKGKEREEKWKALARLITLK